MAKSETTKPLVTAADILWEADPYGCQMSLQENGRVIVHPNDLAKAQRIADKRNAVASNG